jgi:hypothetical protein
VSCSQRDVVMFNSVNVKGGLSSKAWRSPLRSRGGDPQDRFRLMGFFPRSFITSAVHIPRPSILNPRKWRNYVQAFVWCTSGLLSYISACFCTCHHVMRMPVDKDKSLKSGAASILKEMTKLLSSILNHVCMVYSCLTEYE